MQFRNIIQYHNTNDIISSQGRQFNLIIVIFLFNITTEHKSFIRKSQKPVFCISARHDNTISYYKHVQKQCMWSIHNIL